MVKESEPNLSRLTGVINCVNIQHEANQMLDKWLEMETKLKMLEEENMKLKENVQKLEGLNNKIKEEKCSLFSQLKMINQSGEI